MGNHKPTGALKIRGWGNIVPGMGTPVPPKAHSLDSLDPLRVPTSERREVLFGLKIVWHASV